MRVDVAWWDLRGAEESIESLREHLREGAATPWAEVPGLRLKLWIADPARERWGAIMVWDDERPPTAALPPNLAQARIARPLSERAEFRVEAAVEGQHRRRSLHGLGPALHGTALAHSRGAQQHEYIVVDAFTRTPLEGNPVAVFLEAGDLAPALMQRIAKEMNLSEVTFVLPPERGGDARIRIFTPVNELPFAGHPLLGTAVALGRLRGADQLRLETAMGIVPFQVRSEEQGVAFATMEQPVPTWTEYEHADALLAALGLDSSVLPVVAYRNGPRHVLVGCRNVAALSSLRPDIRALSAFPDMAAICFAPAGEHWRSRMFSPAYGVVEDAATGSAAGPLAIHLARHGRALYGRPVEILQGVEMGRPSLMRAIAQGLGDQVERVEVGGHGVIVARGTLHV